MSHKTFAENSVHENDHRGEETKHDEHRRPQQSPFNAPSSTYEVPLHRTNLLLKARALRVHQRIDSLISKHFVTKMTPRKLFG